MKVVIYARCSTDESKQDVSNQIDSCKKYCEAQGWQYEIMQEYESAYSDKQRKVFNKMLERIRLKEFGILLVYMLDRFSRQTPTKIVSDIHQIVEVNGCRFVSIKEGIDSNNDMWQIIMMIFAYLANSYSKMLGIRVREGIQRKKDKGDYKGGRPTKEVDMVKIKALRDRGLGLRGIAEKYNKDLPKRSRISYVQVQRLLQKPYKNFK